MFRRAITAAALLSAVAMVAAVSQAHAKPTRGMLTCTQGQWNKIPKSEIEKCALGGGSMKCSSSGYECCYDGGSFCEWTAYTSRPGANVDLTPPPGGNFLPPRTGRPDIRPPAGPYSPPASLPPRGPGFDIKPGSMTVAQPPRSSGPRIK
jgi:hypothetical protein